MDYLKISSKMEKSTSYMFGVILLFFVRNIGAYCPEGVLDEESIPSERTSSVYEYKLMCTKTDLTWQFTAENLNLDLYWTGCETNVQFCFVRSSNPIKVTTTNPDTNVVTSFMIPTGSGESTDLQYCFRPRSSDSYARVLLETYGANGVEKVAYGAVWFNIRVRGDTACTLPMITNGQESFSADLTCGCNTLSWERTFSPVRGVVEYKGMDFDLCFTYATSDGFYVDDTNDNNRRFNVSKLAKWTVEKQCIQSQNKKVNFVLASYQATNLVEIGMKVLSREGTNIDPVDPQQGSSSPADSVKSTVVSLLLGVVSAVLFYTIGSKL